MSHTPLALRTGASDKTVASVRREMESRSEIPNVEMRTDSLGRQQPASKPDPLAEEKDEGRLSKLDSRVSADGRTRPAQPSGAGPTPEPADRIDYDTGEVLDETPVTPTVAVVREELESSGEVESLTTRTGADGIQQPASKPDPLAEEKAGGREPAERIDYNTGEVLDEAPVAPTVGVTRSQVSRDGLGCQVYGPRTPDT